jgi:hypothetical protein
MNMKPILKYQTHPKILSHLNTLVKELLKPLMEIDSSSNENILIHILIPIPLPSMNPTWQSYLESYLKKSLENMVTPP